MNDWMTYYLALLVFAADKLNPIWQLAFNQNVKEVTRAHLVYLDTTNLSKLPSQLVYPGTNPGESATRRRLFPQCETRCQDTRTNAWGPGKAISAWKLPSLWAVPVSGVTARCDLEALGYKCEPVPIPMAPSVDLQTFHQPNANG